MTSPRVGITTKRGGPPTEAGALYAAAVEAAGGEVVWLEPDAAASDDPMTALPSMDALVLSGGVDVDPRHYGEDLRDDGGVEVDAARDQMELPLIRAALAADLPILGICRGIQMLTVAAGGSLYQDLGPAGIAPLAHQQRQAGRGLWDVAHPVRIEAYSRLAEVLGVNAADVNSFHHQAVHTVAPGFVVTARAPDGVVEGIEHPGRTFVLGVQWHPERMVQRYLEQRRLFEALVTAARIRLTGAPPR